MRKKFKIEVDCANCANKMEIAINKINGIKAATVNFMALKLDIEFDEGVSVEEIMQLVLKACKRVDRHCEIYF